MALAAAAGTAAAAQQQPSNVHGFSGGGYSAVRSAAENQAINNAVYNANSNGWPSSSCVLVSLASFPAGSAWNAIAGVNCIAEPTVTVPTVPWTSGANLGLCIGGTLCRNVQLTMPIATAPAYVGQVTVNAQDDYGDKSGAVLGLFADGVQVGSWQDVKKDGSNLTFSVTRSVSTLTFQSRSTKSGDTDETIINSITVS